MGKHGTHSGIVITGCGWVLSDRAGSAIELATAADTIRQILSGDATSVQVSDRLVAQHEGLTAELRGDKACWMSAIAIEHALKSAGISKEQLVPERTGLVIGSELAGQLGMINFACEVRQQTPRFVSPLNFPQTVGNFVAGALARAFDIKGPNQTIASGPASGLDAIIEGCELIKAGCADVILAGVTEVRTEVLAQAFPNESSESVEGAVWFVLTTKPLQSDPRRTCEAYDWHQGAAVAANQQSTRNALSMPLSLCHVLAHIATGTAHPLPENLELVATNNPAFRAVKLQALLDYHSALIAQWPAAESSI